MKTSSIRRGSRSGAIALALLTGCAEPAETAHSAQPNIVFILTDDMGIADGGALGHPYVKTPHIDRLMEEGTAFAQFYVASPVCSPSRAAFLTGLFPSRLPIYVPLRNHSLNQKVGQVDFLDPDLVTVADVARSAGYATALFGKWHLGSFSAPDCDEYGFDAHKSYHGGGPGWPKEVLDAPYFRARSSGLIVDEAIAFIDQQAQKGRPFFVNLWTLVPHARLHPTPEELEVYRQLRLDWDDFDGWMAEYLALTNQQENRMKIYCAAMTGLDEAIGRLLDHLDETGLAQDTLVIFSSDNGPEDFSIATESGLGHAGPYRGRKRSLYEGGLRTPLVVRWPGVVEAGRVDEESVLAAVDLLPTVAGLVGSTVELPNVDGEDVGDILRGETRARRTALFWEWRASFFPPRTANIFQSPRLALRSGDHKLLAQPDGTEMELYDVRADPEERENLIDVEPERAAELWLELQAWKAELP